MVTYQLNPTPLQIRLAPLLTEDLPHGTVTLLEIIWLLGSKKQPIVAKSSAEAEFPALVHGFMSFIYLFEWY